jgi:putative aldouronate transport system substrate-binding protein
MNPTRTLLISVVAVTLALAGCQPAAPAPGETAGQESPAVDKVALWTPCAADTVPDWNADPILQEVEKATNTDIEVTTFDWGAFPDQLNAAAASGGFPDIVGVIGPEQRSLLEGWAREGVLASFSGDVAAAAPNVLAQYDANPALKEMTIDGESYFQPVGWGDGVDPNMGLIHVRKDLLDKYGMEPPETFEEYFGYLEACQAQGDGSGVVFGGAGGVGPAINAFAGAYGAPMAGWAKTDNGYEFWATQPGVKNGIVLFRDMVGRGLVDPGVWEMDGDAARAAYVSGSACSLIFNGGGHIGRIQNDMSLVDPNYQEWMLPAPDAGGGSRGYTSELMFWGTSQLGGMENNNPVAAARVLNYLISEEGYKLTAVGIEGRDYQEENGEIELLEQRLSDGFPAEASDTGAHPLATCVVSWVPQEWQDWQLLYGKDESYKAWYDQMRQNQGQYQIPTYGLLTTSPLWNDFQATSNELVNRAFLEMAQAASADEAAALFDKFVLDWQSAGGKAAQDEISAALEQLYD